MEGPCKKNGATCRFSLVNLVTVGGGDSLLLPLHRASGNSYPGKPNFSVLEDPYYNNSATCRFIIIILILVGLRDALLQKPKRSTGDSFHRADNIPMMEEPYQEDSTKCRFPVINLVMACVAMVFCCLYTRLRVIPTLKTLISP